MKVKFTKPFRFSVEGDVIDVDQETAEALVNVYGKAEFVVTEEEKPLVEQNKMVKASSIKKKSKLE